ncbi:DUF3365 domain-containing protein [bacterium]|nr:DUF3365 domain-containing protein [bacterium]
MSDYLIAGRGTIAKQQDLIHDATKADKGFTADVYEQLIVAELKTKGIDLMQLAKDGKLAEATATDPVGQALLQIHKAAREVVQEAQPVLNEQGKGFKGFIPAVFGARTADKFYNLSNIRLKQTTMQPRGDYNRPDRFEKDVLAKFEAPEWKKGEPYMEVVKKGGRASVRLMRPLYIQESCLKCHGDPKGELDIAGRVKEGYKVGELRGAISVTVPVQDQAAPAPGK